MEDLDFQHQRSTSLSQTSRYPLSFDQRLIQGDRYRAAAEHLELTLRELDQFYIAPGAHTGGLQCVFCAEKTQYIKQAFYEYYLGTQHGRWDEHRLAYRREMEGMLIIEDVKLDAVQERFKDELKDHFRKDLCMSLPQDVNGVTDQKKSLDQMLQVLPIEEALWKGYEEKLDRLAGPDLDKYLRARMMEEPTNLAGFHVRLQETKTTQERAALFVARYCLHGSDDVPQLRNLKTKYAKQFEAGVPHDVVLARWEAEAKEMKTKELQKAQKELDDLTMAQNAHLKAKQKKIKEEDAKAKSKDMRHVVECSLSGCGREMETSKEEIIECAVCDWLAQRTDQRRHIHYCSQEHSDDDFYEHDRQEHACCMSNECYYLMDPPELEVCGICSDCLEQGVVSLFCSKECYSQTHRNEMHGERGEDGGFKSFHPALGLEIIP